jgi:hypothetical protein
MTPSAGVAPADRFAGDSPETALRRANVFNHTRLLPGPQDRRVERNSW